MSDIKCIIIEDEPLAVKVLQDYIAEVSFIEVQQTFKDAVRASEWMRDNQTDLIFLDIHLPRLKGMAFLKTLVRPPAVIVTTAYHQYAVEGFQLSVTDYLLKPFEFDRFLVAVNKVRKLQEAAPQQAISVPAKDYIFLLVQKKKVKVFLADILYVESQREYIRVVTAAGEFISKMGTHEIETLLPAGLFQRVHRSFIVAVRRIDSYTAETMEIGGVSVPIGRAYRDVLKNL